MSERTLQRSRAAQPVTDELLANYSAARAFLFGEWFGAALAVASFTLLYLFGFAAPNVSATSALVVCLALLALAGFIFGRNWVYYERLGFHWARRWHLGALVVAGSAAIFWFLFGLLTLLSALGIDVGPPPK